MAHVTDHELLRTITEAIQAQERLRLALKSRKNQRYFNKVNSEVSKGLEGLRNAKSEVEGTAVTFEPITVIDSILHDLKQHVFVHVPASLTPDIKNEIKELVTKAFNGTCGEILYIALVTCPWYCATQTERALQAKYNHLFVLYKMKAEQLFSPESLHIKENSSDVIDRGWFYATEVSHFARYLLRGKVRFIEALHLPVSAVIFEDNNWQNLKKNMKQANCLKLKGFIEQCCGQAFGSVGKKCKKTGKMKLRDGATLHEFCDSFRLLHHVTESLLDKQLCFENLNDVVLLPEVADEAMQLIKLSYKKGQCDKLGLFDVILKWQSLLNQLISKSTYSPISGVQKCIEEWLLEVRTEGMIIPQSHLIEDEKREYVDKLLSVCMGGPVAAMVPDNIIMITRAGSHLYGLDTADSDADYIIVYADPIQKVLSSCNRPVECTESRGPSKALEYGAYEVRCFCEMLWKGSVVMLELIYAENLDYTSPLWKELVSKQQVFLTEKAILQYIGLIRNNMIDIERKKYIGIKREQKLFYQILHKLYCLESMVRGTIPRIKCSKDIKDYILRVRNGPLKDDLARDKLYEECRSKLDHLVQQLSHRESRLPENVDYKYLSDWLMKVRGWPRRP